MDINKWIDKNRAEIDEFLGPNNDMYTLIGLKGRLATMIGKDEAMIYFERWLRLELTIAETIKEIRNILDKLNVRGVLLKYITPEQKEIYLKIMKEEFIC